MHLQTDGSSITGNRDTRQHRHNHGRRCHSHDPGGVSRTDRPSVQVRKVKTNTRWRDKLRNQPRLKDHQAYRNSKGSAATESEEDRANATLCLSPEAIGAAVETTSHAVDKSPGSARRGRDVNPASSTASVQCRKAPTYVPARDKLRSQPGLEDHQAYRNSKGSKPP